MNPGRFKEVSSAGLTKLMVGALDEEARIVDAVYRHLAVFGVTREAIVDLIRDSLPDLERDFDLTGFERDQRRLSLEVRGEQMELGD